MLKVFTAGWILALSLLLLIPALAFAQTIICVSPNGNDDNDGSSWELAKLTLTGEKGALTTATSGTEIWVASGVYTERITLKDGVAIYGGFHGNETSRADRAWLNCPTVLNGDQGGSVVTSSAGVTATAILDGFTITNGNATNGGGIYCAGSSPTIRNNRIVGNTALGSGGGIYITGAAASPLIMNNIIGGNNAGGGGGIYCYSSAPTISGNVITGNIATSNGGGIYCYYNSTANPVIVQNRISGNTALQSGGGICCSYSAPDIQSCFITDNKAITSGGGIYVDHCSPKLTNLTIVGNTGSGGGIYIVNNSSPTVANTIIAFNSSGVYRSGGTPVLKNNCAYGNTSYQYSGISAGTGEVSGNPNLASIATGNFHIQANSPCINAGTDTVTLPTVDIDGETRVQAAVDIGADESDGVTDWPVDAPIIYVKAGGDDHATGADWDNAKGSIRAAVDQAILNGGSIWVKAGTYEGCSHIWAYANLYGGFDGTETQLSERDWVANKTILDGAQAGSVLTIRSGKAACSISGFTIQNGSGTGDGTLLNGGGILCSYSNAAILNNIITDNTATGTVGGAGGGIYCDNSPAVIANNVVVSNSSVNGGGISCSYGTPALTNNTVCDNTITTAGLGGGLYLKNTTVSVTNNIVAFNTTGIYAGASSSTLKNNCVYNTPGQDYSGLSAGVGDIQLDPMLADRSSDDYHLAAGSPCMNAGLDSAVQPGWVDIDGQPRISDTHVDIGADESSSVGDVTLSPDGGIFKTTQTVTVGCATPGASIHYTVNGVDPTENDPGVAPGSTLAVAGSVNLKLRAFLSGYIPSAVKTAEYVITGEMTITDVKNTNDHQSVGLFNPIVTAAFTDYFYVSETTLEDDTLQAYGIRVNKPSHGLKAGMRAAIVGAVDTNDDGERFINAVIAKENGSGSVRPFYMTNKTLGGGDKLNGSIVCQMGVRQGSGINNIGLYVRTSGKVCLPITADSFYLDDGSGVLVKVIGGTAGENNLVGVTGACSCERPDPNDKPIRVIRVESQEDIQDPLTVE